MAILAQPQHQVAGADARVDEGIGQSVGPLVQVGIGSPVVAAHHCRALRAAAPVLAQHVTERQVVQLVHAQVAASANRARSSGLITLPVALRGSSSTKRNWRGTL